MAFNWKVSVNHIVDLHERAIECQINKSVSSLQSLGIPVSRDQAHYFFDALSNRMVDTCKKVQTTYLSSMDGTQPEQLQDASTNSQTVQFGHALEMEEDGDASNGGAAKTFKPTQDMENDIAVHAVESSVFNDMNQSDENKVIIDGLLRYGCVGQPNLKFIKVNADCWGKVFDFLSFRDIFAMSQTCQRMHQIAGNYFRENFNGVECSVYETELSIVDQDISMQHDNNFHRFVDAFHTEDLETLRAAQNKNLLSSLRSLQITDCELNEDTLRGFEKIQKNIETIDIDFSSIDYESFAEFLTSCPKLEFLSFLYTNVPEDMTPFISFLQQNRTINCVQLDSYNLQEIPLNTTVQLDYLSVRIRNESDAIELADRLKTLHANGFFKKLCLSINGQLLGEFDDEVFIQKMTKFNELETVYAYSFYTNSMDNLLHLKELHLEGLDGNERLETMAMNLINLQRLNIGGSVNQLKSFLRYSKKLKFIIFEGRKSKENNALNLSDLNRFRRMSGMEQKVQIGIIGKQYLKTKWMENGANYDLIEINRAETTRKYFRYKRIE